MLLILNSLPHSGAAIPIRPEEVNKSFFDVSEHVRSKMELWLKLRDVLGVSEIASQTIYLFQFMFYIVFDNNTGYAASSNDAYRDRSDGRCIR